MPGWEGDGDGKGGGMAPGGRARAGSCILTAVRAGLEEVLGKGLCGMVSSFSRCVLSGAPLIGQCQGISHAAGPGLAHLALQVFWACGLDVISREERPGGLNYMMSNMLGEKGRPGGED